MVINFDNVEEKNLEHFKGGEKALIARMITDENNKILYGKLEPGASIGYHTHDTSSEIIYILEGQADYKYDDESETATPGQAHYCPKGHSHSMTNNGDTMLVFLAVVPEHK